METRKKIAGAGLLLFALYCRAVMEQSFDSLTGSFSSDFSVQEISAPLQSEPADFVIDVRSPEEQSVSIIPGAILAHPKDDLIQTPGLKAFMTEHKTNPAARLIVYCAGGFRSARSLARLQKEHPDFRMPAYNLRSGIIAHANAGGALVQPASGEKTNRVHGYSPFWKQFILEPRTGVDFPAVSENSAEDSDGN
jgi:rhodanese-related sulfurtransferase